VRGRAVQTVREFDKNTVTLYIKRNGDACKRATASVELLLQARRSSQLGAGFFMLLSYLIRKVSRSNARAIIAMTSIVFSYSVIDMPPLSK
jgi:hypothetical protein